MVVEVSRDPEAWAPIFRRILHQVFYRQLGIVVIPCPFSVAWRSIDVLSREGLGRWKWLLTNRALVWEEIPIDHAAKIHVYVFGGKKRDKNTVLIRQGFWRMYFIEAGLRLFDESIIGKVVARI